MMDYHNEFDPYAAQWIRNLMAAGLIPQGEVDERSITDVSASDLRGFKRWHFFSGIGGWALALRLAGWPDDLEICTGSAPCQPFSVAGKGAGTYDSRHLWPYMFQLIRTIRPAVCMGEQVHAAARKGWLDGVLSDLESIGYAGDAISVPACAVNAPHRRDRLWWCAEDRSIVLGHGHAHVSSSSEGRQQRSGEFCGIGSAEGNSDGVDADANAAERRTIPSGRHDIDGANARRQEITGGLPTHGAWDHAAWIACHDGKARRVGLSESGIRRLADDGRTGIGGARLRTGIDAEITPLLAQGVKARVGKLRGFGNMIVPQVAAEMIRAYLDCKP